MLRAYTKSIFVRTVSECLCFFFLTVSKCPNTNTNMPLWLLLLAVYFCSFHFHLLLRCDNIVNGVLDLFGLLFFFICLILFCFDLALLFLLLLFLPFLFFFFFLSVLLLLAILSSRFIHGNALISRKRFSTNFFKFCIVLKLIPLNMTISKYTRTQHRHRLSRERTPYGEKTWNVHQLRVKVNCGHITIFCVSVFCIQPFFCVHALCRFDWKTSYNQRFLAKWPRTSKKNEYNGDFTKSHLNHFCRHENLTILQ